MAAARPAKPVDDSTYAGRFAARLKTLRLKAGYSTGQQVADKMRDLGYEVSQRTYYSWESGEYSPPLNALPVLSHAMGLKTVGGIFPPK